jgi:hypothetical protein
MALPKSYYINIKKKGDEYNDMDLDVVSGNTKATKEDVLMLLIGLLDDGYSIKKVEHR